MSTKRGSISTDRQNIQILFQTQQTLKMKGDSIRTFDAPGSATYNDQKGEQVKSKFGNNIQQNNNNNNNNSAIPSNQSLNLVISILKKNPEFRTEKDLNNLAPLIKEIQFFKQRNIEGAHLNDICMELRYEYLQAGDFVFYQGDYGDRFYVILRGKVQVLINKPSNSKKKKSNKKKMNPVYKQLKRVAKQDNPIKIKNNEEDQSIEKIDSKDAAPFLSLVRPSLANSESDRHGSVILDPKQLLSVNLKNQINSSIPSQENYRKSVMTNNSLIASLRDVNNKSGLEEEEQSQMSSFDRNQSISPRDLEINKYEDQELTMNNHNASIQIDEIRETMNEDDLRTEEDMEEFYMKYTEISQIQTGQSFGDLALIEQKPRMASIRCMTDTHFAVLSKKDFNKVLGVIERKKYNDKVAFLRSLPFFSQLTKTSLGKLTYQFHDISTIRHQILYREGEPAEYVYIVKVGQFEVMKTLTMAEDQSEATKKIFINPLRANKVVNSQGLNHTKRAHKQQIHLFKLEKGNVIGEEDLIDLNQCYTTTVKCTSLQGLVGQMKREDFLRLENQAFAWTQLQKNAKLKQIAIAKRITIKNDVEVQLLNTTDRENLQINLKNQEMKLHSLNEETKRNRQNGNQLQIIDSLIQLNHQSKYVGGQNHDLNQDSEQQFLGLHENQNGDQSILSKLLQQQQFQAQQELIQRRNMSINKSIGQNSVLIESQNKNSNIHNRNASESVIISPKHLNVLGHSQIQQFYPSIDERQESNVEYTAQHRRISTALTNNRRPMTAVNQSMPRKSEPTSAVGLDNPGGNSIALLNQNKFNNFTNIQSQSFGMKNPTSPYRYLGQDDAQSHRVASAGPRLFTGFRSYVPSPKINQNLMVANHTLLQLMIHKKGQEIYRPLACTINHHQSALREQVKQQMRMSFDMPQQNVQSPFSKASNYSSSQQNNRLTKSIKSVQSMRQQRINGAIQQQL
ncbi:cyclic nucleotide-binding domain containing protein [Stylonychia lemnae]|uniref:Cyclic nucleotide-binding domain containing protein n=1 Tax=Stylonychia lemnae TaxID=5949 RepID=A0A078AXE6_STYLE|nr:cyclic nucleotide-binding domain containing protein [Stylonychia lemnae]|eukprot:CDW86844.1 cyclic nucleotide-binding domain containing protein [Stylonychia lemnae]